MAQALELLLACLIVGPCLAFLPQEKVGIPAGGFALAFLVDKPPSSLQSCFTVLQAATKSWVGVWGQAL